MPCLKFFSTEAKTTHTQTDQGETRGISSPQDYGQRPQADFYFSSIGLPMSGLASIRKQTENPSLVQTHPLSLFKPSQEVPLLHNQIEIVFRTAETM